MIGCKHGMVMRESSLGIWMLIRRRLGCEGREKECCCGCVCCSDGKRSATKFYIPPPVGSRTFGPIKELERSGSCLGIYHFSRPSILDVICDDAWISWLEAQGSIL